MESWMFLAFLGGVLSNLSNFLYRWILKEGDNPNFLAWFHEVFRLVVFGIIILKSKDFGFDPSGWWVLLGLGIVEFIGVYFLMKMHAMSHLSISTIISRTRIVWVPVIAFFLLGEALAGKDYLGILVVFLGLVIVKAPATIKNDKGMQYAYVSAFAIALLNNLMKLASKITSSAAIMVFMALPSVILFPIIMRSQLDKMFRFIADGWWLKVIMGISSSVSTYVFVSAMALGPVSKVNTIYQSTMLLSILAGIIVLKEREDMGKKLVGAVITLAGVLLLTS